MSRPLHVAAVTGGCSRFVGVGPDNREQCAQRRRSGSLLPPCALTAAGPLFDQPGEDRIAGVLRDAQSLREGQRPEVQIAWSPAEQRRVKRDDDRVASAGFGASEETLHQFVHRAPVELEPPGRVAHHRDALLHGAEGLVGQHHGHSLRGRGAGRSDIGVPMGQRQHADRA
jgi:hypothetical protein